jgi:hypothetical protein
MRDTYPAYIRKQSDLLAEFKAKSNIDPSSPRWDDTMFYLGMREGLMEWDKNVLLPFWYTLDAGYTAGVYEYAIPSYIKPPIRAQIKRYIPYNDFGVLANANTWNDFSAHIEPDSTGFGQVLRVDSVPRSLDGRIGWMAPNSSIPYASPLPVLQTNPLSSSATALTLTSAPPVASAGIVAIDGELIAYTGLSLTQTTATLSNLVRGIGGTTAASHSAGATVEWCIAADDQSLYTNLYNYTMHALHRLKLADAGTHEREGHQQMMLYHKQQADGYWLGYTPERPASRLRLGRKKLVR